MSKIELKFGNNCLLKCSYCNAHHSQAWAKELKKFGPYPTQRIIPILESQTEEEFWDQWVKKYSTLTNLVINSGEPITNSATSKILSYISTFPNPDLTIEIVSSFAVPSANFNEYLEQIIDLVHEKKIKKLVQVVSLDSGLSEQVEYIRYGMNAAMFYHHVMRFLMATNDRAELRFNILASNLSMPGLQPLLEWILDLRADYGQDTNRIKFDFHFLTDPSYQNVQISPQWLVEHVARVCNWAYANANSLQRPDPGFTETELSKLSLLLDAMQTGQTLETNFVRKEKANFFRFFYEHDLRRNTSFLKTFPDFKEWWQECRHWAENGY